MPKKKLLIFPFNGNGIEALDCVNYDEFEFIGFIDDDVNKKSIEHAVYSREILSKFNEFFVLAVPGSPASYRNREAIIDSLNLDVSRFISVIHPDTTLGRNVKVGYNCLIMPGVVMTSNAIIGNHVCILPNSVIHHDSIVGDYTLIGSNVVIAGRTTIGKNCYIGSGTNIIDGIRIEDYSLLGLGSNVIKDVAINSKMVGNPARNLGKQ